MHTSNTRVFVIRFKNFVFPLWPIWRSRYIVLVKMCKTWFCYCFVIIIHMLYLLLFQNNEQITRGWLAFENWGMLTALVLLKYRFSKEISVCSTIILYEKMLFVFTSWSSINILLQRSFFKDIIVFFIKRYLLFLQKDVTQFPLIIFVC